MLHPPCLPHRYTLAWPFPAILGFLEGNMWEYIMGPEITYSAAERRVKNAMARRGGLTRALCAAASMTGLGLIASPAMAQTETSADAEIRTPVIVENGQAMDFGSIIPGEAVSRLRINPNNGNLNVVVGDAVPAGGAVSAAQFTVTGTANQQVRLTFDTNRVDLIRDGGTETMRLNRFRLQTGGRNRSLNSEGTLSFAVGGQLRVRPNQAPGIYRGTFSISIDYL